MGRWFEPSSGSHFLHPMINIKLDKEINLMRAAGKLASEVLNFITPYVKSGISTLEIDTLCHDYIVNEQKTIPAPLNY